MIPYRVHCTLLSDATHTIYIGGDGEWGEGCVGDVCNEIYKRVVTIKANYIPITMLCVYTKKYRRKKTKRKKKKYRIINENIRKDIVYLPIEYDV